MGKWCVVMCGQLCDICVVMFIYQYWVNGYINYWIVHPKKLYCYSNIGIVTSVLSSMNIMRWLYFVRMKNVFDNCIAAFYPEINRGNGLINIGNC